MIKILSGITLKLMTERFIVRCTLAFAEHLASKTENKLDDKLVNELKEALE